MAVSASRSDFRCWSAAASGAGPIGARGPRPGASRSTRPSRSGPATPGTTACRRRGGSQARTGCRRRADRGRTAYRDPWPRPTRESPTSAPRGLYRRHGSSRSGGLRQSRGGSAWARSGLRWSWFSVGGAKPIIKPVVVLAGDMMDLWPEQIGARVGMIGSTWDGFGALGLGEYDGNFPRRPRSNRS